MSGKGDKRRPSQVDPEHVRSEWDRIFGKKVETINIVDETSVTLCEEEHESKQEDSGN
jgi:hypothetical protein